MTPTTTKPTESVDLDNESADTLAALLCCLYEGPEIQRAATMLIEQAMQIEEAQARASTASTACAAAPSQPVVADERALFEHAERASDLTRSEYGDDYANPCVQSAWEGWQARASQAQTANHAQGEPVVAPCEGGALLPDSCSDCRREGAECALAQQSAGQQAAAKLSGKQIFTIAAPFFAWNTESWRTATQGTINMTNLLAFTQAAIDAALTQPAGSAQPTDAAQADAKDAARWRFMMAIADNPDGPEAEAMERFGNEQMESERPESVQMAEIVDAARAALSAHVVAGDQEGAKS